MGARIRCSTLKNVVLPAPLGPISPHVPSSKRHVHSVQRGHATEANGEPGHLDHSACLPGRRRAPDQAAQESPQAREVLGHLLDQPSRARS